MLLGLVLVLKVVAVT